MTTNIRIYFDACCFIDLAKDDALGQVEAGRDHHVWYCRKFLEAHRGEDVVVYSSTISVAECTHLKDETREPIITEEIKNRFRAFLLSGRAITPVLPTPKIMDVARDITWEHSIRASGVDRIHLATAMQMGCGYFLTSDATLIKRATEFEALGLKICMANDAKELLPNKYKQLPLSVLEPKLIGQVSAPPT